MDLDKLYKIYALLEPNTELVRYVGLTKKSLKERLRKHLNEKLRGKKATYKYNWIQSLKEKGLKPEIILLEDNLNLEEANEKEIVYIKTFKSFGAKLVNISIGGNCGASGYKHSEELKEYFRELNKGRFVSQETRDKLSKSLKGKTSWNKGIPMSENAKLKLSKAKTGKSSIKKGRTKFDINFIIDLIKKGFTIKEIMKKIKCSKDVVSRLINNIENEDFKKELKKIILENKIKILSKQNMGKEPKNKNKSKYNIKQVIELYKSGNKKIEISRKMKIPTSTLTRILKNI
jgi:hypothetical protein